MVLLRNEAVPVGCAGEARVALSSGEEFLRRENKVRLRAGGDSGSAAAAGGGGGGGDDERNKGIMFGTI